VCVCARACACVRMYVRMYVYVRTCVCVCMYVCSCVQEEQLKLSYKIRVLAGFTFLYSFCYPLVRTQRQCWWESEDKLFASLGDQTLGLQCID
jgi:hypothetical protein